MPLVKIDMIKNFRTLEEIKKLADIVQEVMLQKLNAPPRDSYFSTHIETSLCSNLAPVDASQDIKL